MKMRSKLLGLGVTVCKGDDMSLEDKLIEFIMLWLVFLMSLIIFLVVHGNTPLFVECMLILFLMYSGYRIGMYINQFIKYFKN